MLTPNSTLFISIPFKPNFNIIPKWFSLYEFYFDAIFQIKINMLEGDRIPGSGLTDNGRPNSSGELRVFGVT